MKRTLFLFFCVFCFSNGFTQTVSTYAGHGSNFGSGISKDSALLRDPVGGVFDKLGNYYFVEELSGNKVRRITSDGTIYTLAGSPTDDNGFSGDGGLADSALLNGPDDLILDSVNNIYISDAQNNRVRKIDAITHIITTIAGNGISGYAGDGGIATDANLYGPAGLCIDSKGNLYISESTNGTIRKINSAGIITTFAGVGASLVYSGDGGLADTTKLGFLGGMCIDEKDNIYVADATNSRILKIDTQNVVTTYAGCGSGYLFNGDNIPATTAQIDPGNVFYSKGNIYISEVHNYRVRMVDTNGIIRTIAGNGLPGYSGDGGPADSAEFLYPTGCAVDSCGNIYIPEANNNVIRKVTLPYCGYQYPEAIKNVVLQNAISVFPNPAYSKLTIQSTQGTHTVTITNIVGQVVYTQTANANKVELNVSMLSAGVYFVRVNDSYVQKFIKE